MCGAERIGRSLVLGPGEPLDLEPNATAGRPAVEVDGLVRGRLGPATGCG